MSFTVPKLTDGDVANAQTFNTCLNYIESALNSLADPSAGITTRSSALMMYDVPVDTQVNAGDLVYYNKNTGLYERAKAGFKAIPGENGETVDEPTAFVQGMVTQVSGNNATLWIGGSLKSESLANACLGSDAIDGIYYLSTTPGKASTTDILSTRQPVLTYTGAGRMTFMLFYMAHDGHFHKSFTLSSGWTSMVKPGTDETWYRYNIESDVNLSGIGLSADTACVFYDGKLDMTDFVISDGTIWSSNNPSKTTILFTNYPFVAAGSIVRGIYNTDQFLAVENQNGLIKINLKEWTTGSTQKSGSAISNFNGTEVTKTPVVSDIEPATGVTVERNADTGVVRIGSSYLYGALLDAESVEMQGALRVCDGQYIPYFQFPGTNSTSLVITNYIRGVSDTAQISAVPWVINTTGSGTITTTTYFIPDPTENSTTAMSAAVTGSISVSNGSLSAVRYAKGAGTTCTGPGMVLTILTSSNNIRMLRVGHKFTSATA